MLNNAIKTTMKQLTSNLLMIETCLRFDLMKKLQRITFTKKNLDSISEEEIKLKSLAEFKNFVAKLENHGVTVHVIKDYD